MVLEKSASTPGELWPTYKYFSDNSVLQRMDGKSFEEIRLDPSLKQYQRPSDLVQDASWDKYGVQVFSVEVLLREEPCVGRAARGLLEQVWSRRGCIFSLQKRGELVGTSPRKFHHHVPRVNDWVPTFWKMFRGFVGGGFDGSVLVSAWLSLRLAVSFVLFELEGERFPHTSAKVYRGSQ